MPFFFHSEPGSEMLSLLIGDYLFSLPCRGRKIGEFMKKTIIFILIGIFCISPSASLKAGVSFGEEASSAVRYQKKGQKEPNASSVVSVKFKALIKGSPANFFSVIYEHFRYKNVTLREVRELIGVAESTADRGTNRLTSAGLITKEGMGDDAVIDATLRDADDVIIEALYQALGDLGSKPKTGQVQSVVSKVIKACGGTIEAVFNEEGVSYRVILLDKLTKEMTVLEFLRNRSKKLTGTIEKVIFESQDPISFLDLVEKVREELSAILGDNLEAVFPNLKESLRAWLPKDYIERAKTGLKITDWLIKRDYVSMSSIEEKVELFNLPKAKKWTPRDYDIEVQRHRKRVCRIVLNEDEDQLLGGMVYQIYEKSAGIMRFIVPPRYRHLNVELALLNELIAKLGKKGWKERNKIFIDVSEDNESMLKLLMKSRFKTEKRIENGWDEGIDAYRLVYSKDDSFPVTSSPTQNTGGLIWMGIIWILIPGAVIIL